MGKPYQIEARRAVRRFESRALDENASVQLTLPMAEIIGWMREGVGELLRQAGLQLMELVMAGEVRALAGERSQRQQERKASRWGREHGYCGKTGTGKPGQATLSLISNSLYSQGLSPSRPPPPGLLHHSDRGVQYASTAYIALLAQHQIRVSMSRKANPYDNASCESFMKTLKYEEVYRNEYQHLEEVCQSIGRFLEVVYNQRRLHSALGYRPPIEFEQQEGTPSP